MRGLILLAVLAISGSACPAIAQERTAVRQGFVLPPQSGKIIMVMQPVVRVGAQSTGGMFEPNADWTDRARRNINLSLEAYQHQLGNRVIPMPEAYGAQAQLAAEYSNLFGAVARAVVEYQFFSGNRLPTKKRNNRQGIFNWSLGPGVRDLPGAQSADFALFLYNWDAFGSTGRKLLQIVALFGPGLGITSGEHLGYAGLVDLRTGDLLWLNADLKMGGDAREPAGADKRVRQLLEDFPGSARPGVRPSERGAP